MKNTKNTKNTKYILIKESEKGAALVSIDGKQGWLMPYQWEKLQEGKITPAMEKTIAEFKKMNIKKTLEKSKKYKELKKLNEELSSIFDNAPSGENTRAGSFSEAKDSYYRKRSIYFQKNGERIDDLKDKIEKIKETL